MDRGSSTRGLGVYVHVPFCDRVCPYCDFAVEAIGVLPEELEREYLGLVIRELDRLQRDLADALADRSIETLYIGGGTPSMVSPRGVARLLDSIAKRFSGAPGEVTLEVNPGPPAAERIAGFRSAGVTRLSLGVQSFDDGTLRRLGRAHRAVDALRALEAAMRGDFLSVSADLIYGAPGQREEGVLEDVRRVVAFGVPHLSAYALTIEEGTPFARAAALGRLALPDEAAVARMACLLEAELRAAGYERYEVSSFAREGHRSQHNRRYWRREDVLGLGPSAASLLGDLRARSFRERGRWAEAVRRDESAWQEFERYSPIEARRETLFVGMRMNEGVSRAEYWRRHGRRPEDDFGWELAEIRSLGLIEDASGALRPTARGLRFSNEILLRFASVDPPRADGRLPRAG